MGRIAFVLALGLQTACSFEGGAGKDRPERPVDAAAIDSASPSADAPAPDASSGLPSPIDGTLFAFPHPNITIDGSLDDWGAYGWLAIGAPANFVEDTGSADGFEDLSAEFAARYSATHLYLAVRVADDVHHSSQIGSLIWRHDSLQIAFDTAKNRGANYDDTDDWEFGYSRDNSDGLHSYRWVEPSAAGDYQEASYTVDLATAVARYEIAVPATQLGLESFEEDSEQGFALIVNEADGAGSRDGYIEWQSGLGSGEKSPDLFGTLVFWPTGPDA